MRLNACVSSFLRGALTLAFVAMLVQSIVKLVRNDVGTKSFTEKGTLAMKNLSPSFAICPFIYSPMVANVFMGQNKTFKDVMALPKLRDHITIYMDLTKTQAYKNELKRVDLNDEESVKTNFNMTLDDVWTEFMFINDASVSLHRCTTVAIPKVEGQLQITMNIDIFLFGVVVVEIKEDGQFQFNYKQDWKNMKFMTIPKDSEFIHMDKKSFRGIKDCDVNNQQRSFYCIEDFIAQSLDCQLPWRQESNEKCPLENSKLLNDFYETYNDVLLGKLDKQLEEFGCLKPNCIRNSWSLNTMATFDNQTLQNNPFFASYLLENKTTFWFTSFVDEIEVTEEYSLYTYDSLVADVGGFLGLLLGASILSLIEYLVGKTCDKADVVTAATNTLEA